jgi:hypothetical protein
MGLHYISTLSLLASQFPHITSDYAAWKKETHVLDGLAKSLWHILSSKK